MIFLTQNTFARGLLVSYPHPYRILEYHQDQGGQGKLQISSHKVESLSDFPDLQHSSHQWMCDRSFPFIVKLLTLPPLNLTQEKAEELAPTLKNFWANIAAGDASFEYPHLPEKGATRFCENQCDR